MITRTPIGPGWDTLTPGQTIRVGFQEFAHDGTFVRLEAQTNPEFYGVDPVVIYADGSGRELRYLPSGNESPRLVHGPVS